MCRLKVRIETPRFEETVSFYRTTLSMRVEDEWDEPDDRGAILAISDGEDEACIEIAYAARTADFSGLSLQFRVASMDEFVRGLAQDVVFEGPTPRPWGAIYLYMKDPNGISVIAYTSHESGSACG